MAFQLLSKNCALRHNCALRKRQAAVPSPFPLGGEEKYHAAFFTSATIFFAASPRSLAATIGRPELARMSLPCWTFVPSRRTTSGTDRFTSFAAATMPSAMMSNFMMPPNKLKRMPFTAEGLRMNLKDRQHVVEGRGG